jgi:hypothetical protein
MKNKNKSKTKHSLMQNKIKINQSWFTHVIKNSYVAP